MHKARNRGLLKGPEACKFRIMFSIAHAKTLVNLGDLTVAERCREYECNYLTIVHCSFPLLFKTSTTLNLGGDIIGVHAGVNETKI